jgi:hypothetical protein
MTALDSDTVDVIFARLATIYGARFTNQWPAAQAAEVKRSWSHELREFAEDLDAIDYALSHLPSDHAPMVLEVRDLARTHRRVTSATEQRRQAPVTEEDRERAVAILRSFRRPDKQDPKAWARRLRFRELSGERLSLFQRQCWREVLGVSGGEASSTYDSNQAQA